MSGTVTGVISMKAIRPIYDGKDDLEYRTGIDPVDMMVCLFSETTERIESREDISEEEKGKLKDLVDLEDLPAGMLMMVEKINGDSATPEGGDDNLHNRGTEFDEIIVVYEIIRWMQECGYHWSAAVPWRFMYTAQSLGILPVDLEDGGDSGEDNSGEDDSGEDNEYVIHTEPRALHELKLLLPLHWATILLDWRPATVSGTEGKETMRFGNITIACSDQLPAA